MYIQPKKQATIKTATKPAQDPETGSDMVDRSLIFRYTDPYIEQQDAALGDDDDTARVPQIVSAPEGIEVVEQVMGTAMGQWILQVRCQCGRRWFELEPIKTATCSRCGTMVLVQIEERGS